MKDMTVAEFLKKHKNPFETITVKANDEIFEVIEKMVNKKEERSVYVLDEKDQMIGIITAGKIARHFFHGEISPQRGFSPSLDILHYLTAESAKDIMNKDFVYCADKEPLEKAIEKMFSKKIYKSMPVLNDKMQITGSLNIIAVIEFLIEEGESA